MADTDDTDDTDTEDTRTFFEMIRDALNRNHG